MLEKIIGFYMITIQINYEEIVKVEVMIQINCIMSQQLWNEFPILYIFSTAKYFVVFDYFINWHCITNI